MEEDPEPRTLVQPSSSSFPRRACSAALVQPSSRGTARPTLVMLGGLDERGTSSPRTVREVASPAGEGSSSSGGDEAEMNETRRSTLLERRPGGGPGPSYGSVGHEFAGLRSRANTRNDSPEVSPGRPVLPRPPREEGGSHPEYDATC